MNLVVDFGNTRVKVGIFDGVELIEARIYENDTQLIKDSLNFKNIKQCIICSVTNSHEAVFKHFEEIVNTVLFKPNTPIPLTNLYKSALTLGSDRIAASIGSFFYYPNKNVLTIDAGTCIKYNFVNAKNEYLGGAISPGIPMRLKAMNYYTAALPLIELDINYSKLIGQSTSESILSGALLGAASEVDGMIEKYQAQFEDLQIVVTGGDADYLCKQLKSRFFANPNILLYGLNSILNFNLEK